jgi:hypothetical protein
VLQSFVLCVQNALKLTYEHLAFLKKFLGSLSLAMREGMGGRGGGGGGERGRERGGEGKGGREGREGKGGEGEEGEEGEGKMHNFLYTGAQIPILTGEIVVFFQCPVQLPGCPECEPW